MSSEQDEDGTTVGVEEVLSPAPAPAPAPSPGGGGGEGAGAGGGERRCSSFPSPALPPPPPPATLTREEGETGGGGEEETLPPCESQISSLSSRAFISGSVAAFLERLATISSRHIPLDHDSVDTCGDSKPPQSAEAHSLRPGSKKLKRIADVSWLHNTLELVGREIEDCGSFSTLANVISQHESAARKVPESIEHIKSLNVEMHLVRQQMQGEELAHKEAVVNWGKSLAQMKQAIKDLRKQNKLVAKLRADMAIAEADCKRRLREESLKNLKTEIKQLETQVEVEKRVDTVTVEFLKKQTLMLMEEAINLAAGHDNDVMYMDLMLNKLRDQKVERDKLLSDLEPRYNAEMAEREAREAELQRDRTLDIDDLGKVEMQEMAATKIQRVWRGHVVRLKHSQELKKIAKKRKELRKKKKSKDKTKDSKKKGGKKK